MVGKHILYRLKRTKCFICRYCIYISRNIDKHLSKLRFKEWNHMVEKEIAVSWLKSRDLFSRPVCFHPRRKGFLAKDANTSCRGMHTGCQRHHPEPQPWEEPSSRLSPTGRPLPPPWKPRLTPGEAHAYFVHWRLLNKNQFSDHASKKKIIATL